jgi:hypothetical protein
MYIIKQLNVFESRVYRRILGPVYDNEKEKWRILTDKETITETDYVGLDMYREWKKIEFPKDYCI